jgi:glycosyltransferase involved in cell wall biosynthesis
MRIVMVAHSNAPWTPHYARFFMAHGHEVLLISFCPDRIDGVEMVFVGREPFRDDRDKHLFVTRARRVAAVVKRTQPAVVFAPYLISNGLTAALAWSGPLVASARGSDVLMHAGRLSVPDWLRRCVVRFVSRRSTFVHAVSREIADALAAYGVPRDRIRSFPMGVNLKRFPAARREGPAPRVPHLICTRRHDTVYQNHVIVEALARLFDTGRLFRFTFVGGGRLLEERRAHVEALNLQGVVKFVPHQKYEDVPRFLQSADIYVSASLSDGTSSSLLEAMACGVFPVVTRIAANAPWVRDGKNGYTFPVADAPGLADALSRAIDQPELRASACDPNREMVTRDGDQEAGNAMMLELLERTARGVGR